MSVKLLLPGVGSTVPPGAATTTVLASEPVADALIWPIAVKVMVPPGAKGAGVLMLPVLLEVTLDPTEATAVQVTQVSSAGNVSATVAPTAVLGPLLVTVIV